MSCCVTQCIVDMNEDRNVNNIKFPGPNFAVDNLAALPTDFTSAFKSVTATTSGAVNGPSKVLPGVVHYGLQVIATAKGSGFSSCAFKLQMSNVGGAASGVWFDIPSATLTLTDVGGGYIALANEGLKIGKLFRLVATAAGGDLTFYAILYGVSR